MFILCDRFPECNAGMAHQGEVTPPPVLAVHRCRGSGRVLRNRQKNCLVEPVQIAQSVRAFACQDSCNLLSTVSEELGWWPADCLWSAGVAPELDLGENHYICLNNAHNTAYPVFEAQSRYQQKAKDRVSVAPGGSCVCVPQKYLKELLYCNYIFLKKEKKMQLFTSTKAVIKLVIDLFESKSVFFQLYT